ncbi:hypothetical protein ERD78_11820 [Allopusillimonas soli]|uniref:DUF91 domain-containing protein n=1 Tax=Allopusillimonas soli TaxID=659016 RepID=A0A853FBR3_9BURK|nr:hypothetical protein [Allopusillimonas soli]NYT37359.1 hypothetical protein [Allopusillimonas soli]TEA74659.1 hypothetical protein ERD78_11820 [Allopusillimonas soli]
MTIYRLNSDTLTELPQTSFNELGLRERTDIQRILKDHVEIISKDVMVLAEEYGDWEDSRRRIDLLGLTREAQLVVIELKRTEDGGHMELQALRYAAMVSTMTFRQAVEAHQSYLSKNGKATESAEERIREFLDESEDEPTLDNQVRIVLASADFSKEITSSVLWLNEQGLDITCVRLRPHLADNNIFLDIQQVIPLPEASEFQVAIREKNREREVAQTSSKDYTKYCVITSTGRFEPLNKRGLIFKVVQEVIGLGIKPEQIMAAVSKRGHRLFISLNGQHTAPAIAAANGKDEDRFFSKEEEVFVVDDKSYLLMNQWSKVSAERALAEIFSILPEGHGISYQALG